MRFTQNTRDMMNLCYFLKEYDGALYEWKLLKALVYPLSCNEADKNSTEREKIKAYEQGFNPLFSYRFSNELCYEGVADSDLERDMEKLVFFGYVLRTRPKKAGFVTNHYEYSLTESGKEVAEIAADNLSTAQIMAAREIIETTKDMAAETILSKYAKEWCGRMTSQLEEDLKLVSDAKKNHLIQKYINNQNQIAFTNLYILPFELNNDDITKLHQILLTNAGQHQLCNYSDIKKNDDSLSFTFSYEWGLAMNDYGQSITGFSKIVRNFLTETLKSGSIKVTQDGILSLTYRIQYDKKLKWYSTYIKDILRRILQKPLWTIGIMDFLETKVASGHITDRAKLLEMSENRIFSREYWPSYSCIQFEKNKGNAIIEAFRQTIQFKLFNYPLLEFTNPEEITLAESYLTKYRIRLNEFFAHMSPDAKAIEQFMDDKIDLLRSSRTPPELSYRLNEIVAEVVGGL